jgi:hypothetical protein
LELKISEIRAKLVPNIDLRHSLPAKNNANLQYLLIINSLKCKASKF